MTILSLVCNQQKFRELSIHLHLKNGCFGGVGLRNPMREHSVRLRIQIDLKIVQKINQQNQPKHHSKKQPKRSIKKSTKKSSKKLTYFVLQFFG